MKKIVIVIIIFILSLCIVWAEPSIAILDFENGEFSEDIAKAVSEIFRSKIILSNEFKVIERNDMNKILDEQNLRLSSLTENEDFQAKLIQDVDYIVIGKMNKLDNNMYLVIKILDIVTGEVKGSSDRVIKNMDTLDSSLNEMALSLISIILGREDFTFATGTYGISMELGVNFATGNSSSEYSNNPNPYGFGFSLGFTDGKENFWYSFTTSWTFLNEQYDVNGFIRNKILSTFGGGFIFGNKVEGLAFTIGAGGGYDFAFGSTVSPYIGIFYKNIYIRYKPTFDFYMGDNPGYTGMFHCIEAGYSFFFGEIGKEETGFY